MCIETDQGQNGTANTGGGGGGGAYMTAVPPAYSLGNQTGKSGGSGVVIVKEPEGPFKASGIWDMNALYDNVKAGTWTNA
jgi:hypothetical protein